MEWPTQVLTFTCSIFLILWFTNILNLILNKATVPIVLPTKDELKERVQNKQDEDQRKKDDKLAKEKKKYD